MFISRTAIVASLGTIIASAVMEPSIQSFLIGAIFLPMPLKFFGLLSAKFASETGMISGLVTMLAISIDLSVLQSFVLGGIVSTLIFHSFIFYSTRDPGVSTRL
jgi:hypothetical protein